jgi:hypothetical protein
MTTIDFAEAYEQLAETVADHFGCVVGTDVIRATMIVYQETLDDIDANPHLFDATVNLYLLAKRNAAND